MMRDNWIPENVEEFALYMKTLRAQREKGKATSKARDRKRVALTAGERKDILGKTANRCHVCGGPIKDSAWQADHVLAHSGGGEHSADNYLPAHGTCNSYRWDYLPAEFQEILRLGVWLRTQIEKQTPVGRSAGDLFIKNEKMRIRRRKQARQ